ncbi:MAG: 3-deoxy-D-manno-octulosonic acid transferase [Roseibium sp.]|nr:3-deoxy-D-manno-octulosonic acid transferase [Roseibium sp.]
MAERRPLPVGLYLALSRFSGPLYRLVHEIRARQGKDDPARRGERFGRPGRPRPAGSLVWVHAASVGETNSVLPLIHHMTAGGQTVLLTTVTRTSAAIAAKSLPPGAIHQYAPFDSPVFLDRFLDHWQPAAALFVESEIWPAMFDAVRRRDCPLVLVNGRMSSRSYRGWSRLPGTAHYVFASITLTLAQSEEDGRRLGALGCGHVVYPGNLKFDASTAPADPVELDRLSTMIGSRPVWVAALTHPGEEELALAAHRQILNSHPDALLLLCPRHPERGAQIDTLIGEQGFTSVRRSLGKTPKPDCQVFLGDTLGEMGLFYSLAPVAFLGGSFAEKGGHNPVEAIRFGSALISGPGVANARGLYHDLWDAQAAVKLEDAGDLAAAVLRLMEDQSARDTQIATARAIADSGKGAVERTMAHLRPLLAANPAAAGTE